MRAGAWPAATAVAAVAAVAVAGCGGSGSSDKGTPTPNKSSSKAPVGAKRGGDLKVAFASDVDYLDPRQTYYQYGFFVTYAIQRPLYSYKPDDPKTPQPDLASGPPQLSSDGKTVTVKVGDKEYTHDCPTEDAAKALKDKDVEVWVKDGKVTKIEKK